MTSLTHCAKCCEDKPTNELNLCSECQLEFDRFIEEGHQNRVDKKKERSSRLNAAGSVIKERSLVTVMISDIFKKDGAYDLKLHMTHSGQFVVGIHKDDKYLESAVVSVEHVIYEVDRLYQNWLSDRAWMAIYGNALNKEEGNNESNTG